MANSLVGILVSFSIKLFKLTAVLLGLQLPPLSEPLLLDYLGLASISQRTRGGQP